MKHVFQIGLILVAVQLAILSVVWFISAGEASLNPFDWGSFERFLYLLWTIVLTALGWLKLNS